MNLVDGIITEDSDAFLFGAQTIYKNMFSDKKFVEVGGIRHKCSFNCCILPRLDMSSD